MPVSLTRKLPDPLLARNALAANDISDQIGKEPGVMATRPGQPNTHAARPESSPVSDDVESGPNDLVEESLGRFADVIPHPTTDRHVAALARVGATAPSAGTETLTRHTTQATQQYQRQRHYQNQSVQPIRRLNLRLTQTQTVAAILAVSK